MKKIIIFCFLLVFGVKAHGNRVKRIVGGATAAIPQPIPSSTSELNNVVTTSQSTPVADGSTTTAQKITTESPINNGLANSVFIYEEERSANILGINEKGFVSFKGIRYAEPPTKGSRFQRPVFKHLKGKIEAYNYGSHCVQPLPDHSGTTGKEDCLFLNVFTPTVYSKNASGAPVLFWIHGGGFSRGSGNQYGVKDLMKNDIVVITMNYRLGSLGFLGSTNNQQLSGNAGLFDVRAAFEWTRRYITYFGGDPKNIITAGQGNGASLAMLLAQSDFTAGYIKGVLAMSGTGISSSAVDYTSNSTSKFISQSVHCSGLSPIKTIRCLQGCDLNSLSKVENALEEERIGDDGFVAAVSKLLTAGPVVEGKNDGRFLSYFLTNSPLDALKAQTVAKVPLLMGTTKSETGGAITGKYRKDVEKRLKVPDFLEKVLPSRLLEFNVGLFSNGLVNKLINALFKNDKYLKLFATTFEKGVSEFQKVIETTTDALFNFPAATTSSLWNSAGGNAYFYSFEYQTKQDIKKSFLDGLKLQSSNAEKTVSHGDDLFYLFELQDLDGKPVSDAVLKNDNDLKVKEIFISVIKNFMTNGKPKLPNSNNEWKPFSDDNTYAVINEKPEIKKKFRQCQIALWGASLDKLTDSSSCNFPDIANILSSLPQEILKGGLLATSTKTLEKLLPLPNVPNPVQLPVQTPQLPVNLGLIALEGSKTNPTTTQRSSTPNRFGGMGGLGGFLG